MKDKDIQAELESLQAQVAELNKSRQKDTPSVSKAEKKSATEDTGVTAKEVDSQFDADKDTAQSEEQSEDLISQFQELLNALDEDIKQTKPATLLVIFALGVLVGRMLPR